METQIQIDTEPICTITTRSGDLLKTLKVVAPLAKPNKTLPICDHFLIEISERKMTVTSSNGSETIVAAQEIDGVNGEIKTCIPATQIVDLLGALPADTQIEVGFYLASVVIKASEQTYKFHIVDFEAFPKAMVSESVVKFSVDSELMMKIIQLNYATRKDSDRPALQSILMDFKISGVCFAASNGYTIHQLQRTDSQLLLQPIKVLVLGSSLETLKGLIKGEDEIKVNVMFNNITFEFGDVKYITKRVDAKFPEYESILFGVKGTRYCIYRLPFLLALKRINILQIHDGFLLLKFENKLLEIHGKNEEYDMSATEKLEINEESESRKLTLSFSINHLIEILKNLDCTEVVLEIEAENKFVKIEAVTIDSNQKEFAGIMPIKPYNYE